MAQHSHSRPPSLHCLLVVHTGLLAVANKCLVHQEEHMDSAEEHSHSPGESVDQADQADQVAVRIARHRTQVKERILQRAVEGIDSWRDSKRPAAAEDIRLLELQVLLD